MTSSISQEILYEFARIWCDENAAQRPIYCGVNHYGDSGILSPKKQNYVYGLQQNLTCYFLNR
jgi:hypothetical protein